MKYKILFVTATSKELKVIKESIKQLNNHYIKPVFLSVWIWNYNTILQLGKFLSKTNIDFAVNIGVCGNKDVYKTFFQVGRIYNLSNQKEEIVPIFFEFWNIDTILCSEQPVYNPKILKNINFVDMESYGFEICTNSFKIPRIIIKIPVDKVWEETKNFDYIKALDYLKNNLDYSLLISKIVSYLEKLPVQKNLEFYYNFFWLSEYEKHLFIKLFNKYKALTGNDFKTFFEKNKHLPKKKFLELLFKL